MLVGEQIQKLVTYLNYQSIITNCLFIFRFVAGHVDSDMYAAWVDSTGTVTMVDSWSTKKALPKADAVQSYEELKGSEDGGVTSIQFSRLLDTG